MRARSGSRSLRRSRTSFSRHFTWLSFSLSRAELFWPRWWRRPRTAPLRCHGRHTQEVDLCRLLHRPLVNVSDALHPLGLTPRAMGTSTNPISKYVYEVDAKLSLFWRFLTPKLHFVSNMLFLSRHFCWLISNTQNFLLTFYLYLLNYH
jgi:hypothetical protein